jgi:hypothetical protein
MVGDTKSGKKKDSKSWFSFSKKEYQIPQSMNVTWAHDILSLPGKPPTRGFGGRFYFYNEKTQAIPVDGELMVYGFDDTDGRADSTDLNHATKRFKFTAEQLTSHFSEGQLGASYSVWIPWDAAPGADKKIMLIPIFVAKDGRQIRSTPATVNMPGKKKNETQSVIQVSAEMPKQPNAQATQTAYDGTARPVGITTLNLPRRPIKSVEPADLVAAYDIQQKQLEQQQLQSNALQQQLQANALAQSVPQVPPSGQETNAALLQQTTAAPRMSTLPPNPAATTNGWALPQFSQPTWDLPATGSSPNSRQVPASSNVQPASYPTLSQQFQ